MSGRFLHVDDPGEQNRARCLPIVIGGDLSHGCQPAVTIIVVHIVS